jgi:hypothetical protein
MNIRKISCFLWVFFFWLLLVACQVNSLPDGQAPITPPVGTSKAASTDASLKLTLLTEETPRRYAPVEFTIEGVPAVSNPFAADEADLHMTLVGPDGITATIGGFWFQGYTPNGEPAQAEAGWRARFTPSVPGKWHATASFQPSGFVSNDVSFEVSESSAAGFVRVDADNPRYFAYDDGSRFLPIGVNMGWWDDDPIENYTRWLDHFTANGGNMIRVWMANWSFALEWNDTGLGDYRLRLRQAWLLDELFRIANERGVKIILVLNHHGQFSRTVNAQWQENPYNVELGGPLDSPEQFASDPTAMAFFQQRLRYIVDRWAAQPNLLGWEWWNEYNFTPIDDELMAEWLTTMDAFLASRDPYDHLVTISGPNGATSPIWQRPGIDFVSVHIYTTEDLLPVATELAEEYAPAVVNKPLLLAEYGFATGTEGVDSLDQMGIHLHNGLWAAVFAGHAGTSMYWWWDTYIEPLGLWSHFGALATFIGRLDLADFEPGIATVVAPELKSPGAEGLLLTSNDHILLWVRSNQYTGAAVTEAYDAAVRDALRNKQKLETFMYTPTAIMSHSVKIDGVRDGKYEVHWYDPQTGTWGSFESAEATGGTLSIPLPTFTQDIAAEIRPLP